MNRAVMPGDGRVLIATEFSAREPARSATVIIDKHWAHVCLPVIAHPLIFEAYLRYRDVGKLVVVGHWGWSSSGVNLDHVVIPLRP